MLQAPERDRIHRRWDRLTDDDLETIGDDRSRLVAAIEQRYGCARDAAEAQVRNFEMRTAEDAEDGATGSGRAAPVRTVTPTSRTSGAHPSASGNPDDGG